MAKGDHLYFSFLFNGNPITHHGVDCGDGYVIHYESNLSSAKIVQVSKNYFGEGKTISVKQYGKSDPPQYFSIKD